MIMTDLPSMSRATFLSIVKNAAQVLSPEDAERVINACAKLDIAAWGVDSIGVGPVAECPLRAAGFTRIRGLGWNIGYGGLFTSRYDKEMRFRVFQSFASGAVRLQ